MLEIIISFLHKNFICPDMPDRLLEGIRTGNDFLPMEAESTAKGGALQSTGPMWVYARSHVDSVEVALLAIVPNIK